MNSRQLVFLAALLGFALPLASQSQPRRILYVIETRGYHHSVTDHSADVLKQIGDRYHAFAVDVTRDSHASITADNLKNYDAVVFMTTGELPLDDQQKQDFLNWIKAGHGFVGIHCATDTFYKWPEYGEMIGGYFDDHPWHAGSTLWLRNEDRRFPSQRQWPKEFQWTDEFYQFKDWDRSKLHVLLSMDPNRLDMSKSGIKRTDKDFANAWVKMYGQGRVFYTALGHDEHSWDSPKFQQHLLGGIRWADGDIKYTMRVP